MSLTETKLFHFHRIFKKGGCGGGGLLETPEHPLDPPLIVFTNAKGQAVAILMTIHWTKLKFDLGGRD